MVYAVDPGIAFISKSLYILYVRSRMLHSLLSFTLLQPVLGHVRMEGHSMQQTVHATVQMATVGIAVKVSALHEIDAVYGVSGICNAVRT